MGQNPTFGLLLRSAEEHTRETQGRTCGRPWAAQLSLKATAEELASEAGGVASRAAK